MFSRGAFPGWKGLSSAEDLYLRRDKEHTEYTPATFMTQRKKSLERIGGHRSPVTPSWDQSSGSEASGVPAFS